jgi:hypothetical protein
MARGAKVRSRGGRSIAAQRRANAQRIAKRRAELASSGTTQQQRSLARQ